jgi:hypothetical protein
MLGENILGEIMLKLVITGILGLIFSVSAFAMDCLSSAKADSPHGAIAKVLDKIHYRNQDDGSIWVSVVTNFPEKESAGITSWDTAPMTPQIHRLQVGDILYFKIENGKRVFYALLLPDCAKMIIPPRSSEVYYTK